MKKNLYVVAALSLIGLSLTACGSSDSTSSSSSKHGKIQVVTTTDVYADIVKQIAGDTVDVTALVSSTSQDPHSYELTAADRLKVKNAGMVVLNGAGYDTFLESIAGVDNKNQQVVNAVKTSGLISDAEYAKLTKSSSSSASSSASATTSPVASASASASAANKSEEDFNEHVWYDMDSMKKVTDQIAANLSKLKPENADTYKKAAQTLDGKLDTILSNAKSVNGAGKKYLATEPVPGYLLQDAGLTNATPEELTAAVESESDIPPLVIQGVKDTLKAKQVSLFAFNPQTESTQTKDLENTAKADGVADVSFTETLPEGKNYVDWMTDNVANIKKAVA